MEALEAPRHLHAQQNKYLPSEHGLRRFLVRNLNSTPANSKSSTSTKAMAASSPVPFTVKVHPYASKVKHACAYELGLPAKNALVFIGGLTDGPQTVPYIRTIAARIQTAANIKYSVFEIRIRSSFDGFGWGSLAQDVEDISAVVKYLRSIGKEKIVLMGHSTGSQVSRVARSARCVVFVY